MDSQDITTSRFSIVIPTFSNVEGLRLLLASIVEYTNLQDVEIICVANGANEETRTICHEFPVLLTWLDEPCGYAAATNLGVKRASGEYVLLLNDDTQVLDSPKNQWLETLCTPFSDPKVALTGIHEIYSHEIRHNFPPFYCVMIRREMFEVIGYLDESFISFAEDCDFVARLIRAGYKYVNVDADAAYKGHQMVGTFPLYHVGSVTVHQNREAYEQQVQRNLTILRERYKKLRLLVAIPNYGTDNIEYLQQVVNELCSFKEYEVSIVIHSSVPMVFGHEQVTVQYHEAPPDGDWINLAWECRKTIYENRDAYDLFLYNENDQLVTERNIDAFLRVSEVLPEDKIAGFIRYEDHEGQRFYPDFHRKFVWDSSSVFHVGEYAFAHFTNLHQGSFLVTRKQLDRAIEIAGENAFYNMRGRVWSSPYDSLARVSTDLYDTGFEKVIPVSHFDDFLIHHLPDKYYGVYDTKCDDVVMPIINSMVKRPKYSIVVPTFRHLSDCLIPCCETLKKYTDLSNMECVIVANGCGDDGTREYVESLGEPFRLIWFDDAQGFTRATNAGIREARGQYLVMLNNDVYFTDQTVNGWLDKLQSLWDKAENPAVVGALVEDVFIGKKFVAFYLAMTSRKVLDKVGLLDESVFSSGGEDVDWCIRAQNLGYEIIGNQTVYDEHGEKRFAIDFPIHHLGEQTVLENPNFMEDWQKSNAILTERYGTRYSIVIPTFNHVDDLLRPCIESIIEHTDLSRVECLIVANGCTDQTREFVESLGHPFKLIWVDEKIGFTKATNLGMKAAEGKYIIFLNNDTILKGEWIPILEQAFIDRPDCGASGPLKFIGEEGTSNDFLMFFCCMISREAIDRCGYLDERFAPAGVEDVDYGIRLQLAGYKLIQVPEGEAIDRRTDLSSGSFPIVHMGNASYGKEEGWHDILKRNNELLKQKFPEYFSGMKWLETGTNWFELHRKMKEIDQQVYYELFEVDVYSVLKEEVAGKTIIDIGGNKGYFSIKCIELGAKESHCFEPVKSIYEECLEMTKGFPQIHSHNLAVLDGSVDSVTMHEDSWCSHIWGEEGTTTPCVSLENAVNAAYDGHDLVLKLDCEGSEYEILLNTPKEVLRKFSTIYLEIHELPNPRYRAQGKMLLRRIESLGFKAIVGPQPGTWFDDGKTFIPSPITMYKCLRQPVVNVIISTYQRPRLLREALDSVLAQTYRNINVLVVADGKDEQVEQIVSKYQGHDISFKYYDIPHDGNIGSRAKIHGIEQVKEGYVCFLDDDNVLLPEYAETMVSLITPEKQVGIVQVLKHRTFPNGEKAIKTIPPDGRFPEWENIDTLNFLVEHSIAKKCKESWMQQDGMVNQDFKFITECLKHTGYGFEPKILAHHREVKEDDAPKSKVWDVFPFFQEFDVLELRLNELDSVVDKFVIVEANMTHAGNPKPYYLSENMERFAKWKDKIIIKQVDLTTLNFSLFDYDPTWVREHYQRDAAREVLYAYCAPQDFIIVGDVDEIPRASKVKEYIESNPDKAGVLVQSRSMYYLNYRCVKTDEPQLNSKILPYLMMGSCSLNDIRFADKENLLPTMRIEGAGWHLTFLGGLDAVTQKVRAWAHQEIGEGLSDENIVARVDAGQDIYDSANSEWELVEIDETFPKYVQEHQKSLIHDGLIKPVIATTIIPFKKPRSPIGILKPTVTACVSTKDRYFSTLPMCIAAIANQTRKPEKLVIYDDGEQLDLREHEPYEAIFRMLEEQGIKWEVVATPRKGQVTNHQHCLDMADTTFVWRVDDDLIPCPDNLERLLNTIRDYSPSRDFSEHSIGAVAGLIHHPHNVRPLPDSVTGKLADVSLGLNMQWFAFSGSPRVVEHLYSSFLYRVSAAREAGGYPINLSVCGHREESIFSHQIHRAGYVLLIQPDAKSYHLQAATGGIRAHSAHPEYWEHDEAVFQEYLRVWGVDLREMKLIALDCGIGDTFAFKSILPEIYKTYPDKNLVLAVCYEEVFKDIIGLQMVSIADAKLLLGSRFEDHSVYKWMAEKGWAGSLTDAMMMCYGTA
jgi:FkbM family methyltransferase